MQPRRIFDDMAFVYTTQLVKAFAVANSLIDVYDKYAYPNSIKEAEQSRREGLTVGSRKYEVKGGQFIPPLGKVP